MSATAHNLDPAATPPPDDEDHLKRNLSNRHIQLIALGGAIGTGLFMGSGKTIHIAGPSIMVVYVVLGTIMFFVLRAMGEILLHNLRYKSFMDFSHDLVGPWAGYFAGWTYWAIWVIIAVGDMIVVTGYFDHWIHNMYVSMVCTVVLLAALLVSNLLTVRLFGEIEFWFAIIKIVAIVVLILVGVGMVVTGFKAPNGTQASFAHLWSHGGIFPLGAGGFLAAFPAAIYSFIGSELIGTTAAETHDPYRTIPKAINAVPVRIMIFYVLALAVIMAITPWDRVDPEPVRERLQPGRAGGGGLGDELRGADLGLLVGQLRHLLLVEDAVRSGRAGPGARAVPAPVEPARTRSGADAVGRHRLPVRAGAAHWRVGDEGLHLHCRGGGDAHPVHVVADHGGVHQVLPKPP